jgi:asparagine synthase (glutamine-hydrolysing)
LKNDLREKESMILKSLDSMIHFEQYERKILLNEKSYFLGFTAYNEYPITSFENNEFLICLEGRIYNKDDRLLNMELNHLAKYIFEADLNKIIISEWLLNSDGDFVIFILNKKSNRIAIMNDALSRLPLYYYCLNGQFLISREVSFIQNLTNSRKFDRMAIAQILLFSYSLGEKTLLEKINRLGPSSLIRIDFNKSEINIDNLHRFNFGIKKNINKSLESNASQLVSLFSEACKNRAEFNGYKNILSLSGGLDSRSVASGLKRNEIPYYGATFIDFHKSAEVDVRIAEKVANLFDIEWKLFRLGLPKGKDLLTLLRIKNGLNSLGMSFILPFFEKIKETYGQRILFFTGDGGDKALPDQRAPERIKNVDGLVNSVVFNNQIFSLNKVSALTGIQKDEIIDEIKNYILSYPEQQWDQKYVHFIIYERGFKLNFEGEDRNRFYFWSIAPFFSIPFFKYAMNCPDAQKSKYDLYRNFLLRLSPDAANIDNCDWGMPITSNKLILRLIMQRMSNKISRDFRQVIKKNIVKQDINPLDGENLLSDIICNLKKIDNCNPIFDILSFSEVKNIITNCTKAQFLALLTLTSSIEKNACNKCTIQDYYESSFM